MSSEEKAKELVEKFHQAMYAVVGHEKNGPVYTYTNRATQCALICVEEILNIFEDIEDNPFEIKLTASIDYWNEVKHHIENYNTQAL